MKIQDAIDNSVEIVCADVSERDKAVSILEENGATMPYATAEQLVIYIQDKSNVYMCRRTYGEYPNEIIPASQFITSNT